MIQVGSTGHPTNQVAAQPAPGATGQYRGHTASTGASMQSQYRGHTASTGAPDKQTQKGRNRKADPEGQKHRKAFPLSCKGGSREGAPASRESCCTLIFSGGGFYLGATSSGLEMLRPQATENNMSVFWTFFMVWGLVCRYSQSQDAQKF